MFTNLHVTDDSTVGMNFAMYTEYTQTYAKYDILSKTYRTICLQNLLYNIMYTEYT